jgi:hypothetical protein
LKSTSKLAAAILVIVLGAARSWAGPQANEQTAETSAEYLYGMPGGLSEDDLEELIDAPRLVGMHYRLFNDAATGERRVGGYAEVIAVYDTAMQYLVDTVSDFEGYPRFVPRILEAGLDSIDGARYRVRYDTGVRLLGMEIGFKVRSESVIEQLDGGSVAVRSRMLESLDGGLYENYNSFYMEPVVIDGRPMTFIRYFNRPGIRKPTPGTLQIVQLFSPSEARAQVSAIGREAVRRAGGR